MFRHAEAVFSEGGYARRLVKWARDKTHITLKVVRRISWMQGSVVIRRRWVVERTFPSIIKCRSLARDYEQLAFVVETAVTVAASATLVRRWS